MAIRTSRLTPKGKRNKGQPKMKKSDITKQEIAAIIDQAEAVVNTAEAAGRELTPAEQKTFNAAMAKVEPLQERLKDELQTEANINAMRAAKQSVNTPTLVYGSTSQPRVVEPKLGAFKNSRDAHDCGLWLSAVLLRNPEARDKLEARRGSSWLATQNESSVVDGGYLVPQPLSDAIIVSREQIGATRKLVQMYPTNAETLSIPKRSTGLTVYYPGEEGAITDSSATFGAVNLVTKKRAVLTYVSNELRDDSIVPIMDVLAQEMGHALALKEDGEYINGDGTSTYGGVAGIKTLIAAATASISQFATGHDLWAETDISDLTKAMSKLADQYRVPGQLSWLCSAAFKWQVFDRLAVNSNGALSQVMVDGIPQDMFLGFPIVLSDRCPTTEAAATVACYFGNFKRATAMAERSGVRVALSEHVAFTTDRVALRATTRYDISCHEMGDTSTAGAVIGLKTAA